MSGAIEIRVPDGLWEPGNGAALSAWYYSQGDYVETGTVICEIMVEKTAFEIEATASGHLSPVMAKEDAVVAGDLLATIDQANG